MSIRLTPRGAYVLAWATIGSLYAVVAGMFPTEVATIAQATAETISRFGEALAVAAVVIVIAASLLVLGAVMRSER